MCAMHFAPHNYQVEAINRIIDHKHYGLLLDMGLGKSVITLTAIEQLMYDYYDVKKVLVIAPKKVAESTWTQEACKWEHTKHLRVSKVLGPERERIEALTVDADVYVINRENVQWLCDYYKDLLPFDMLVIDESSSFKNPQAKRFKRLKRSIGCFKRVILLTGTPAPNTLMDLWAQIYLLDQGERLGRTISSYRVKYFTPDKTNGHIVYSYKLLKGADREIHQKIEDICMSLKSKDYLKLPDRIDRTYPVIMTAKEKKRYKELEREAVLTLDEGDVTAVNAAALANKLMQLSNGAIYDDDKKVIELHNQKLEALSEIAEANEGKPILVFYTYIHDKDRILNTFKNAKLLESDKDIEEWNKGNIPMLLAHPASAAYGLNLQAGGNIIVWYGLTWSLEQYQQANARLHRQGQEKPVIIHHLVTEGTIDERVMKALDNKEKGQDALLEAIKAKVKEYNNEHRT